MEIGKSAGKTKLLAYVIGVYLGDGCMQYVKQNNSWNFRLNTIDKEFAEQTRLVIRELTGNQGYIRVHSVSKSSKPNNALAIGSKELFWIPKASAYRNKIPGVVWGYDRGAKLEFIAGVMDSEGYVSLKKDRLSGSTIGIKATEGWILDFYKFASDFGLKIGKIGKEVLKSGKTAYRYHFNVKSWFDSGCYFKINRKNEKLRILRDYMLNTLKGDDIVRTHARA